MTCSPDEVRRVRGRRRRWRDRRQPPPGRRGRHAGRPGRPPGGHPRARAAARHDARLHARRTSRRSRAPPRSSGRPDSVVLLCVKSHQTATALDDLAAHAPDATPVVSVQNGVANERAILRRFARTYAVCVMLPSGHLEPGVVAQKCHPTPGILDVGRIPRGVDELDRDHRRGPASRRLRVGAAAGHHGVEVPQADPQPRQRHRRGLRARRRRGRARPPGHRRGRAGARPRPASRP